MNNSFPALRPPYGQNSLGVASRKNGKDTLARIEHVGAGRMLHCRSVDTLEPFTIHESDFTPMPTIPSKYREYNFHALAPYWAEALRSFPNAITIQPSGVSQETLVRKLRESRVAKETYGWTHPSVDEALWLMHSKELVITPTTNGLVQIGKELPKETTPFHGDIVTNAAPPTVVDYRSPDVLESFCAVLSQKIFNPKPSFIIHGLTPDIISDFESRYDVGFTPREDGKSWDVIY